MKYIAGFLKWTVTILAGLAGAAAAFMFVVSSNDTRLLYHRAGAQSVCMILKSAEAQKFVTPQQRIDWAKVATPGEEDSEGRQYAAYYTSDCTMTTRDFFIQRSKQ
jgi:hypothetical protein